MTAYFIPNIVNSDAGFSSYLSYIYKIPSLTLEEEITLSTNYHTHGNLESAHTLVTSHLKLVVKIARKYIRYGLPFMDLVSEGNLGLMKAVKNFDYANGARLSTYATWWVKASIHDYILRSWSLVKIGTTVAQKRLFFNLSKIKRQIRSVTSREFSQEDYKLVASALNVTEKEVNEMNIRMNPDYSLDAPLGSEDGTESSFMDLLPSGQKSQELIVIDNDEYDYQKSLLYNAMDHLNARERYIIQHRKLSETPKTLSDLSDIYGVSMERIRQIEESAFSKIKKHIAINIS